MTEKLKIDMPVIVEGKYDQIKLDSVLDANVIPTRGFGVFKSPEMREFLTKLAQRTKIIVLTDSDGAGRVIRNHLRSFLPPESMINLYIPDIKGKEKRKAAPSKAGTLGVEGMSAELLRQLFAPYAADADTPSNRGGITKADLYDDGLLGGTESKSKRYELAKKLSLPKELSANAFLEALNMLLNYEEYKELLK